jgi:hypothetical protein
MPIPPILHGGVFEQAACGKTSLSLDNVIAAIQHATPDQAKRLAEALGVPTISYPLVWDNWMVAMIQTLPFPPLCRPLQKMVEQHTLNSDVTIDKTQENSDFKWKVVAGGCIIAALTLAEDALSNCECGLFTLDVPGCLPGDHTTHLTIAEVQFPNLLNPLAPFHQGNAFQMVLNQLADLKNQLFKIQNLVQWKLVATVNLNSVVHVNPFAGDEIFQLRLGVVQNHDPARLNWSPPEQSFSGGVQRFGKVVFNYADGTKSGVHFWNINNQVIEPEYPAQTAVVYLNDGVECAVLYKPNIFCAVGQVGYEQSF